MIDIHTHIMPGVDDGASNYQMAIQMLRNAAAGGTTDVFLTPHCAPSYGFFNANDERLASCFKRLCYEVAKRGIQVRLHPGMEILFEGKQEFLYQKNDYYPLCGSRYYLIEHYFNVTEQVFLEGIESVAEIGGIPIVAHPERYEMIQEDCLLRNGACMRKAAEIINGDRVAVGLSDEGWTAWGIPYAGTSGICHNKCAHIFAIVVLRQAKENRICKLSPVEALPYLYSEVTTHQWDSKFVEKVISLLTKLVSAVPVFLLECVPDESAVVMLQEKCF